jgi:hypothetical protein
MSKARFLAGFVGLLAAGAACSKDDPPPIPASEAPAAIESASAVPVASALASASASATAPASASASAQPPLPARASAHSLASARGADADAAPACGDKPLPPCPLNAWMKANASPASVAEDFDGLAAAFDKIVGFAPAGSYPNWTSIAHDGADAARAQSLDGAKAACRGCHSQYKDKYKREMRDRPI